jgi:hypothetical protein
VVVTSPFGHIYARFDKKIEGKQYWHNKTLQHIGYILWQDGKCTDHEAQPENTLSEDQSGGS